MKLLVLFICFASFLGLSAFSDSSKSVTQPRIIPGAISEIDTLILNDLVFADFFSPNGDGHNDEYFILNVENYPNNVFKVFNRWGEKVYDAAPYKNDWTGICTVNGPLFDKQLPEGVYYFEFNDGVGYRATGKITLKR